jgi:hypothetical protein
VLRLLKERFLLPHIRRMQRIRPVPVTTPEEALLEGEYREIERAVKELEYQASVRLGRDYRGRWET